MVALPLLSFRRSPNRVDLGNSAGSGRRPAFVTTFNLPCNATGACACSPAARVLLWVGVRVVLSSVYRARGTHGLSAAWVLGAS